MTQTETTNMIIRLSEKGWTGKEILALIAYISTHCPSEQEAERAVEMIKSP